MLKAGPGIYKYSIAVSSLTLSYPQIMVIKNVSHNRATYIHKHSREITFILSLLTVP